MKYINSMYKFILSLSILLLGTFSYAQNSANSPFSSFALGEIGGLDHAAFIGIGNSTITMNDSTTLNFYNPSSYHSLAKHQPLFSIGLSTRFSTYSENGIEAKSNLSNIQHFAIAFPFAKRFGLAFGLKPYASKGYEFNSRIKVGNDSLNYIYSGTGNINEGFAGFSIKALDFNGAKLSLGANFGYLFGQIKNTRKSGLIQTGTSIYAGGINTKVVQTKAFHYTIGVDYTQRINENQSISLSAVFDPFQNISAKYEDALFYSSDINNPSLFDSLIVNDSLSGNISTIPTFTYGLKYELNFLGRKGKTNQLNSQLSFHLSYTSAKWAEYQNTFDPSFTNTFLNSTKYTFGIQYLPETDYLRNIASTNFFSRVSYRAGVYQVKLPYVTNGEQVTDLGTTFGFGIPIVIQNSLSSLSLGFSIGKRGVNDSDALTEKYYGFNVGISIAPGSDKWFVKRKLN